MFNRRINNNPSFPRRRESKFAYGDSSAKLDSRLRGNDENLKLREGPFSLRVIVRGTRGMTEI